MRDSITKTLSGIIIALGISAIVLLGLSVCFIGIDAIVGFKGIILDIIVYIITILTVGSFITTLVWYVYFRRDTSKLLTGPMKSYDNFVIMDEIRSGGSVFGIYFHKYKNGEYEDSFFFSFYNRYRFDNAELVLNKIEKFCKDYPLITDKYDNYRYLDKLFVVNRIATISNERVSIDQYLAIKNIKRDFAKTDIPFTPIEDAFIGCSKKFNSLSTKQLFEGKFLHILSYYNKLKEVL